MTTRSTLCLSGLLLAALFLSFGLQLFSAGGRDGPVLDIPGEAAAPSCDEGDQEGREPWGRTGYSRGCYRDGLHHGRWTYWDEGYLNLEGFFKSGRKHGAWTVYNEDGTTYVKIFFEEGEKRGKRFF